jgi:glyoxylase-like metal-dependent hydrolase (beta-lactamase superfamily II)
VYTLDLLIPSARFVFAVDSDRVDVIPEHRPPEAFAVYAALKGDHDVVGMTTFPNSVLLRGPKTIVVDPGLHLQNEPVIAALAARGVDVADVDLIALTHAHLDHAGACGELEGPVAVHELELHDPGWPQVSGLLPRERLRLLRGESGELAPGITWLRTPAHTDGSVCYLVETTAGPVALAGDTIGPSRDAFDAMAAPDASDFSKALLAAWTAIRELQPALIVAGHLPPFVPV